MQFIEFSPHTQECRSLIASASLRHGTWVDEGSARLERVILLRSASAPGLSFVGGITAGLAGAAQSRSQMSVGGVGLTIDDALASCVGEAIERTCQWERPGDVIEGTAASLRCLPDQLRSLVDALEPDLLDPGQQRPVDLMRAKVLDGDGELLLPADWCLRRGSVGPLAIAGAALSTGCATGATAADAAARALLELIERDAAALWWLGGVRGRPIAAGTDAAAEAHHTLDQLRAGTDRRRTTVLDITSDLGIPVIAAVSSEAGGRGMACGLACRLDTKSAVRAALLEMAQMELGLELARYKLAHLGNSALSGDDRRHLRRATELDAGTCPILVPDGEPRPVPSQPAEADRLGTLAHCFREHGIAAAVVDLTRPDAPLPVIKAVAPRLQQLPGDHVTARLAAARIAGGPTSTAPII